MYMWSKQKFRSWNFCDLPELLILPDRFPTINNLIQRINLRKRRDSLILGTVIGVCTILLLLYAFHWKCRPSEIFNRAGFVCSFVAWDPQETELSGWRTLVAPEQRDNKLVQLLDGNKFQPRWSTELVFSCGTDEGLVVGCFSAGKEGGDKKYK